MSETPFADDHDARSRSDEQILLDAQTVIAEAYVEIVRERQVREMEKAKRDQLLSQSVPFKSPSRVRLLISATSEWFQERLTYFKRS